MIPQRTESPTAATIGSIAKLVSVAALVISLTWFLATDRGAVMATVQQQYAQIDKRLSAIETAVSDNVSRGEMEVWALRLQRDNQALQIPEFSGAKH